MEKVTIKCQTLEDTKLLAEKFAKLVQEKGCFVNLYGEIGAGKTALVRLTAEALGVKEKVTSPSFVILNEYHSASIPVYHFDLYRLEHAGISTITDLNTGNAILTDSIIRLNNCLSLDNSLTAKTSTEMPFITT